MLKLRLNSWRSTINLSTQYDWNVKMFSIQIEAEYVRGVRNGKREAATIKFQLTLGESLPVQRLVASLAICEYLST